MLYDVNIQVENPGTVLVSEFISYNFGTNERHGIYRTIPYTITNSQNKVYELQMKILEVKRNNQPEKFEVSTQNDKMNLKIGKQSQTLTGVHNYEIIYRVSGALRYFPTYDELYWNAIGTEFDVPIQSAKVTVKLPDSASSISAEQIKSSCYYGNLGSTLNDCQVSSNDNIKKFSRENLAAGEGLTVVVGWPKGITQVIEPKVRVEFFETFWGKITAIMLGIIAVIWYILIPMWIPYRWYKYGRDPRPTITTLSAGFDPPKTKKGEILSPAETGALLDEVVEAKDIAGMMIDLARRGYIGIEERAKKDFYLLKKKQFVVDKELSEVEKRLLKAFFGNEEKSEFRLKGAEMYTDMKVIREKIYKQLVAYKFFPENPQDVRDRYAMLSGVAMFTFNLPLAIVISIFGRIMPRKTLEGINAANTAKSLRNFLTSQERQLNFQSNNQMMFEKLLPYAVALGVEKQWANRFEQLDIQQPTWYQGYSNQAFHMEDFSHSLRSSVQSFNSAAGPVSTTGSSSGFSGGSSGGGGGGGGGGSW